MRKMREVGDKDLGEGEGEGEDKQRRYGWMEGGREGP